MIFTIYRIFGFCGFCGFFGGLWDRCMNRQLRCLMDDRQLRWPRLLIDNFVILWSPQGAGGGGGGSYPDGRKTA